MLHDFDATLSVIDIFICLIDMGLVVLLLRQRKSKAAVVKKVSPYLKYRTVRKRRSGL